MDSLRLNCRVIAAADTTPLIDELRRFAAAPPDDLRRCGDVLALALEKLTHREEEILAAAAHQVADLVVHLERSGPREENTRALLVGPRDAFRQLTQRLAHPPFGHTAMGQEIGRALENHGRRRFEIRLGSRRLSVGPKPALVGIVNVTPDSFSDGGRHFDRQEAIAHGIRLAEEGADVIDVGGESTRPGSDPVDAEEELARVLPVVAALAARVRTPISIDTRRARVAREAARAGAAIINDVTGLQGDPDMPAAVAETGAAVVIMHILGEPKTMQDSPRYDHLMADICRYLRRGIQRAAAAGVHEEAVIVDPGVGFGKTLAHNLAVLSQLGQLRTLGRPIMVGPSRKRFIGQLTGVEEPAARTCGTAAACAMAVAAGAMLLRVHDVAAIKQAVAVAAAVVSAGQETP